MKKIPLHRFRKTENYKKYFALVDDEDFEYLNQWNWYRNAQGYAVRSDNKKIIRMHRVINKTPGGLLTDHINEDKLDNRRSNLRAVDKSLNSFNVSRQKNNTSGHRGVSWMKQYKRWEAYIWKNYQKINLGYFHNLKKAIKARKEAEQIYYGVN